MVIDLSAFILRRSRARILVMPVVIVFKQIQAGGLEPNHAS
jgi:hypothetical protein